MFGDDPAAIADALLEALRTGASEVELAGAVAYAASLRIARFHTSNEFGDWDTALHTFSFANAVHQGLRRTVSAELLRGVFDAAMSVFLDRFLNVPQARLPNPQTVDEDPEALLAKLPELLNRQQQVNEAAELVARYLHAGGAPDLVFGLDDQTMEAAVRQYQELRGQDAATHVLVAATRYLAAHAPTVRAQGQTYQIASRLHRGELIYEDA